MTDPKKMPTLTEIRQHMPSSYWNPARFSVHFVGDKVDPEDSEMLSFVAYRVNIRTDMQTGKSVISIWFYQDDDDVVINTLSTVINEPDTELSLEVRQYDSDLDLSSVTTFDITNVVETETEVDWGASNVVGFMKVTFAAVRTS